jgi:predicted Zn-dependent protease
MKLDRSSQVVALSLTVLFSLPAPRMMAFPQQKDPAAAQAKPQTESPEEKKLREREESLKKKEEERRDKEAKARTREAKKYQTLREFAEDQYASDPDFRDQVDDAYLDLQSAHALSAYRINTSHPKELLATENEGEVLKIRRALYDNPRVQEYVNRLGQQIVPDDSEKLYSFKVTVNPIPAAYTLSTGTVLVSTGMISLLDNEAQLAYVLAHELGHVYKDHWRIKVMMPLAEEEYNKRQEKKRLMWAGLMGLAGVGLGAAINGKQGAGFGGLVGLGAGYAIGSYYSQRIASDWETAQENEADDFALKATLGKSFDIQEVPRLYETMARVARVDSRTQLGFLGARSRIRERTDYAQKLIGGSLQPQYQEALKSNKIKGTSPEFNLIMSQLKRDNGIEAFYFDMFQMAKMNLQQSVTLRSDDPLAVYYYGRVLKQVGRTKEELDTAQQSLQAAIRLDTRQAIPEVQLHRALMLMDNKDQPNQTEAVAALKAYIVAYERKRVESFQDEGLLPSNVDILYDYMRLLGDKNWRAPELADIMKMNSGGQNGTSAQQQQPSSIPRVETPTETLSPTKVKSRVRPKQ